MLSFLEPTHIAQYRNRKMVRYLNRVAKLSFARDVPESEIGAVRHMPTRALVDLPREINDPTNLLEGNGQQAPKTDTQLDNLIELGRGRGTLSLSDNQIHVDLPDMIKRWILEVNHPRYIIEDSGLSAFSKPRVNFTWEKSGQQKSKKIYFAHLNFAMVQVALSSVFHNDKQNIDELKKQLKQPQRRPFYDQILKQANKNNMKYSDLKKAIENTIQAYECLEKGYIFKAPRPEPWREVSKMNKNELARFKNQIVKVTFHNLKNTNEMKALDFTYEWWNGYVGEANFNDNFVGLQQKLNYLAGNYSRQNFF